MMQVIRDKAQGVVAWIIVAMITFVFCFWGVSSYLAPNSTPVLAKIRGRKITIAEVDDIYNRWLHISSMQKDFDIKQVDPILIKQQITQSLAQQAALVNGIKRDGFTVSEAMVIDSIRNNPQLQQNGQFSIEMYKNSLAQLNIDEATFESAHREELLLNQLQLAILTSSFSTKGDTEHIIALKDQKRSFGYSVIPAANYVAAAQVSDAAIEEFYNLHKAQFVIPQKVQLEYVELSIADIMQQLSVTDEQLQEYYNTNLQSFNEPKLSRLQHIMIAAPTGSDADRSGEAAEKIEDIHRKLQLGANFSELAKKESEDKQSAVNGGDLGWTSKSDSYPVEVFALAAKGDYTKPVQTDYGWHIFMLAEVKGGGVKSFATAREAVLQRYKREAAEKLFVSKGEELAKITFENPSSLNIASEQLNLPIVTTELFSKQGGKGIASSENVLRAAFSDELLVQQHNSELIRLSDDSYIVARVKEHKPEQTQAIDAVRDDIIKHLKLVAARDQAKQAGDLLIEAINQGNSPNRVTASVNLQWNMIQKAERDTKNLDRAVLQHAFAMNKPTAEQKLSVAGFSLPNGDYAVIALNNVSDGVVANSEDSNLIENIGKQIAVAQGRLEFATLQNVLIEQEKIKYLN